MKKISILIISSMLFFSLSCTDKKNIVIWSYNEEAAEMLNVFNSLASEPVKYSYSYTLYDQFEKRLDPVFESGRGAPDIFVFNDLSVRKYVESGKLLDLTDIYERNKHKLIAYPTEIGMYENKVYALSWNVVPAAFFYRRSLARKYLGIDDPAAVQTYISDIEKFINTADLINRMSNGRAIILIDREDLFDTFLAERNQPWIVSGKLEIDPVMFKYMETSKLFFEKDYDAKITRDSEGWYAGMNNEAQNANSELYEVLGYFLSEREFYSTLKLHAKDTYGDWAMTKGPAAYHRGGTWFGAWAGSSKSEEAKNLIESLITDETFLLTHISTTNEIAGNLEIINKAAPDFSEPFLGGQNHYETFAGIAQLINGKNAQSTDALINELFKDAARAYSSGEMTLEEALAGFTEKASEQAGVNFITP